MGSLSDIQVAIQTPRSAARVEASNVAFEHHTKITLLNPTIFVHLQSSQLHLASGDYSESFPPVDPLGRKTAHRILANVYHSLFARAKTHHYSGIVVSTRANEQRFLTQIKRSLDERTFKALKIVSPKSSFSLRAGRPVISADRSLL